MLHFFSGKILDYGDFKLLINDSLGIKITYFGIKQQGDFFLFPVVDSNNSTIYYLAFDDVKQMEIFNKLHKISGIGYKIANYISTFFSLDEIKQAIEKNDLKFFIQVPGIGQKTAKKILLELKDKLELQELEKIDKYEEQKEKIIKTLFSLGYKKTDILKALDSYDGDFSNIQEVIKYVISRIR